jgi:hypothetical protein
MGALTYLGTTDVPGSYGVFGLGMDPSGAFLYATTDLGNAINSEPGTVLTFAIDPSTGTLAMVDVPAPVTGFHPVRMSILPGRATWTHAPLANSATPTPTTFTVGGTVTGLSGTVVLTSNSEDLPVSTSSFTFANAVPQGGSYNVTVKTNPTGQTCTVTNGSGQDVQANVTNVTVNCGETPPPPTGFTIGGTVTGVPPLSSIVLHNGTEDRTVTGSGSFSFANAVSAGGSYSVTVLTQPSFLSCSVASGSGQDVQANVTDVAVTCTSTTIGLGAVCTAASGTLDTAECGSLYSYCVSFNAYDPPLRCTMSCMTDGDCPIGANGVQNCNTSHFCRP